VAAPSLDSFCEGLVTYPGDIKNTSKILQRKKRTDTSFKKGKAIPLQVWTGPEDSRRLRLPDFKTISTERR